MAKVFCSSTGSNTAPYETWAKAATSLATAMAAASTAGDVVALDVTNVPAGDKELAGDTTYTFAATNVALIVSTNSGVDTITPTTMGTTTWVGNSTTASSAGFVAANRTARIYGLTMRVAGTTGAILMIAPGAGADITFDNCYFWQGSTNSSQYVVLGGNADQPTSVTLINPTFRFNNAGHALWVSGRVQIIGGSLSSAGTIPTGGLFRVSSVTDPGGSSVVANGFDLTALGSNPICGTATSAAGTVRLSRCKLGTGFTAFATLTNTNLSNVELFLFDCAVGDTHGFFGYYNALGSCVSDTGITTNIGDPSPGQSWKIVTTANANAASPFYTPWIDRWNTGTSAITPRIEILRDGSTTAFTDAEVWGEFITKTTSGNVLGSYVTDRQSLGDYANGTAGVAHLAGAGLGSWDGESGTAWSGKVNSVSSVTPAEEGFISGRVGVAAASTTVYVEPVVRW